MALWVDTDFGFDDLWALLLLRHLHIHVDGISLVAGNAPLPQVARNALGAKQVFGFDWSVSMGAAQPIKRAPETAGRILGPCGMQSRGQHLPQDSDHLADGIGLVEWLMRSGSQRDSQSGPCDVPDPCDVLALGPLTNLALLFRDHPQQASKIRKITWMGGSSGRGNHTAFAEYNAIADPEALDLLVRANAPLRIIDLQLCRQVTFGSAQLDDLDSRAHVLLRDLLGGYLDIALSRGRDKMAIYDPLAALSIAAAASIEVSPAALTVCTEQGQCYGQTVFVPDPASNVEIATDIDAEEAIRLCFVALEQEIN